MNVLQYRVNLKSLADFCALDKETLLSCRSCGKKTAAEIMDAVQRQKPSNEGLPQRGSDAWSLSPEQANAPVAYLRLSVRAMNVLEGLNLSTVGQLAKISDRELLSRRNFGKRSLREVRSKLAAFCSSREVSAGRNKQKRPKLPAQPKVFIDQLLLALSARERKILIARFGLWEGECLTLQDLGDVYGCTRERIRQLESRAIKSLRWPGNMDLIQIFLSRLARKHFRAVFQKGLGLATEDELQNAFLSLFPSPAEGMTAERFLSQVFLDEETIYQNISLKIQDGLFASSAGIKKRFLGLNAYIQERLGHENEPLLVSKLASHVRSKTRGPRNCSSQAFILRCIEVAPNIAIDSLGRCGLAARRFMRPKTIKDMIISALNDLREPAHYSQVVMRLDEMFPDKAPFNSRYVHGLLGHESSTFVWQTQGTYGLAAWGLKKAPFVKDRLVQVLDAAQHPMSLDQIIPMVLETCRCKEGTVSAILETHPDLFFRFDNGIYGLKLWVSQ